MTLILSQILLYCIKTLIMAGYLDRVSVLSGDNIYFQEKRKSSASVVTNVSAQASEVCEITRLSRMKRL